VPPGVLEPAFDRCVVAGYLRREPDGTLNMTPRGLAEYDRISAAWRDWLAAELADWGTIGDAEFELALNQAARQFVIEDSRPIRTG
jgi:hypothetical protein